MGFQQPSLNSLCNIWTTDTFPVVGPPRVVNAPCNLAWGKRVSEMSTGGTGSVGVIVCTLTLLMEATADIRGGTSNTGMDVVEVPAGSHRYYYCVFADYIGLGFANEHKGAILRQIYPFKTPDT